MTKTTLSRRQILERGIRLALVGSTPILLNACSKPELHCEDVSALSEDDRALRSQLEYRDLSPYAETKSCSKCAFYKAGKKNECGKCTLVKGPINPRGYCNSWSAKG